MGFVGEMLVERAPSDCFGALDPRRSHVLDPSIQPARDQNKGLYVNRTYSDISVLEGQPNGEIEITIKVISSSFCRLSFRVVILVHWRSTLLPSVS